MNELTGVPSEEVFPPSKGKRLGVCDLEGVGQGGGKEASETPVFAPSPTTS